MNKWILHRIPQRGADPLREAGPPSVPGSGPGAEPGPRGTHVVQVSGRDPRPEGGPIREERPRDSDGSRQQLLPQHPRQQGPPPRRPPARHRPSHQTLRQKDGQEPALFLQGVLSSHHYTLREQPSHRLPGRG